MFTFFEGPDPSDGLRMKRFSPISSTDWDMMLVVRRRAMVALWDRVHGDLSHGR